MHARTTRLLKEARSLFWPWCAVSVVGLLPLFRHPWDSRFVLPQFPYWVVENISSMGFFFGIPLLAALSLGNEFQHRTISLLLSQPIRRMEIWGEKLSVMVVAVVSAALVFSIGWRAALRQDPQFFAMAGASILIVIASATFWTLLARSTMGGLALIISIQGVSVAVLSSHPEWFPQTTTARSIAAFAVLSYASVMLWLGRRELERFQWTGSMAGENLLMAGQGVMPGALTEWIRCRPATPYLNLMRKEFRLLRPVWLLSLLALPVWIGLPVFGYTLKYDSVLAAIMAVSFVPLIAVLSGTMSLGEERTSGTQIWNMTLPVPARRQWLIKLVSALFTGMVCSVLLPTLVLSAGGAIFRWPQIFENHHAEMAWLLAVGLLTFASFWCASAVNGTVRAALWVFPVMIALVLAGTSGGWFARDLTDLAVSRFDLFADFRFTRAVSNLMYVLIRATQLQVVTLLLVPTVIFAAIQSCRLFRKQLQDNALFVVRRLAPLAVIVFLCSFSFVAFNSLVLDAQDQMWTLFRETHQAIEKLQPGMAKLDAGHPLQPTVEDLAKASPLSEHTRRWLRGSRIEVGPVNASSGRCCGAGISGGITGMAPGNDFSSYSATIHLPTGSACTMWFQAGRGNGILAGVCE